jgi:hypothetical protein
LQPNISIHPQQNGAARSSAPLAEHAVRVRVRVCIAGADCQESVCRCAPHSLLLLGSSRLVTLVKGTGFSCLPLALVAFVGAHVLQQAD